MKKKLASILRGFKILDGLIPGFTPVSIAYGVFYAAMPFANIVISAQIINAFAASQDFARILRLALLAAGINFAVGAVKHLLERVLGYYESNIYVMYEQPLNDKQMEMDYAQIEDPETRFIRQRIANVQNSTGHGLLYLYWQLKNVTIHAVTVALSIGFFAPVLASGAAVPGFWGYFNTPLFSVLLFLLVAGNAGLGMLNSSRYTKKLYELFGTSHFLNLLANFYYGRLMSKYQMGKDIKINSLRDCINKDISDVATYFEPVGEKWGKLDLQHNTVRDVTANLLSAAVYIFVAVKAVLGSFGIGSIVQYVGAITRFNSGFVSLATTLSEINANMEALDNYLAFLDKPDKIYHGTIPVEKRDDNEYEIEFKNVSFKYPGGADYALRNLNLKLRIGQRLAVVGMNGSGKTTMIKLLCRLYDPTEGEITLNGIDIRKYDYNEYMGIFSVVFQDFQLFSVPLGQNVAANTVYDSQRVTECLEKAGVAGRVASMPKGLETSLYKDFDDEGIEISGGEAQKIAIARALYKNAPFIVLDEPTAALDPISEFEVYSKINDFVESRTAIFISHRLSSCRFCDDIAVFHEGELIQRGGHDRLVADQDGKYYQMWTAQAQHYTNVE